MKRVSALSQEQVSDLEVENFVYHIIKSAEKKPIYLTEVRLANSRQEDFFKRIISKTGFGTQYSFVDTERSVLATETKRAFSNPQKDFLSVSKNLALSFLSHHTGGNTSDGVFIVSLVTVPVDGGRYPLLAMLKLDYSPVMRQKLLRGGDVARVELEEVLEALSEQESSVQKKAIIDLGEKFDWDALAVERHKTGQKLDSEDATSEYFRRFLGVALKETNSTYSKQIVKHCHRWAKQYEGDLDDVTPSEVRHKAVSLLDAYEGSTLNYAEIKSRICTHSDPAQARIMGDSFDVYMNAESLQGISFSPKPRSIDTTDRKGEWQLDGGITVTWTGERNPNVLKKEKQPDGSYLVTIKAVNLLET